MKDVIYKTNNWLVATRISQRELKRHTKWVYPWIKEAMCRCRIVSLWQPHLLPAYRQYCKASICIDNWTMYNTFIFFIDFIPAMESILDNWTWDGIPGQCYDTDRLVDGVRCESLYTYWTALFSILYVSDLESATSYRDFSGSHVKCQDYIQNQTSIISFIVKARKTSSYMNKIRLSFNTCLLKLRE